MSSSVTFSCKGKKRAVLRLYAKTGKIVESCEKAGVSHQGHRKWLMNDPIYADEFEVAKEMVADKLEEEIWRRAHDGVEVQVGWYKGQAGGTEKRYSDPLTMFHMKKLRPEYRENFTVDVNHTHNISADDARAQIAALVQRDPNLISMVKSILPDDADDIIECEAVALLDDVAGDQAASK